MLGGATVVALASLVRIPVRLLNRENSRSGHAVCERHYRSRPTSSKQTPHFPTAARRVLRALAIAPCYAVGGGRHLFAWLTAPLSFCVRW